jgi:hypothetical protein
MESAMAYWLLKTEPEEFSWDDQVERGAKGEPWTGVRNHIARRNLKQMKKGEEALFYHTGDQKQVVGIVEVVREAYPDPTDEKSIFVAVTVAAETGDARGGQGRTAAQGHGAGEVSPSVGPAGHAGAVEDRLRDGRDEDVNLSHAVACAMIRASTWARRIGERQSFSV